MASNLNTIKDQLSAFASREAELAKLELLPAAKNAGKGSAVFVVSLGFALHAVWMFVIALAALFTWLMTLTGLSLIVCMILGFLCAGFVSLILAGIFAFIGVVFFKKVRSPKATIEELKATVSAIGEGWTKKENEPTARVDLTEKP